MHNVLGKPWLLFHQNLSDEGQHRNISMVEQLSQEVAAELGMFRSVRKVEGSPKSRNNFLRLSCPKIDDRLKFILDTRALALYDINNLCNRIYLRV